MLAAGKNVAREKADVDRVAPTTARLTRLNLAGYTLWLQVIFDWQPIRLESIWPLA